jgi:hypothetical protein
MADEPQMLEITDRGHAAALLRFIGMSEAREALRAVPDFKRVPGFALAEAVLDSELGQHRAAIVMENLRAVARAGVDVAKTKTVTLETGAGGLLRLAVTMMDLADLAGGGS